MIDKISLKILKILQEKARIPNVEVARQVGMAPSAVLERIRKLEKQGIIDGYEVRLNPERFKRGLVSFLFVRTDEGPEGPLGDALAAVHEVMEVHYVAGEDCYLVKLRVADTADLAKVLRERIRPLPGVTGTRTAVALATVKETPRIPLDESLLESGGDAEGK